MFLIVFRVPQEIMEDMVQVVHTHLVEVVALLEGAAAIPRYLVGYDYLFIRVC